ncbi:isocitrate lyase/PEP mutase family protein [Sphingobium sp. AR-3-1]|uniref:Isocitrate lyase/PEP mutase family protein n=1 Tax=Sphingobium psychrophilum TaxID=2728834 RepID=A0A7X9WZ79_9SPHN|nr:isocitrate lyase/PEP mutase family protein [Sphingobium psychrophilum]NML12253.1 isocitrate lyase/PEP mutase family protein [Sphingobium psychrophilum]
MSEPAHVAALKGLLSAGPDGRRLYSVPGCWDGLTALLIERAGFPIAFLSGGALSMGRYGRPDMGLVTASEVAEAVAVIRDRIAIPLIVDADTGFGNALTLQRALRSFERAGASAVQIEDQGFPKRCGHMAGKTVVPLAESVGRIRAALDVRQNMLVIARTDALAVEGLDAAIDRAEAYLAAGADLIFIEGPRTMDELERIAARFAGRVPLVHNLVEGGVTPTADGATLETLGFAIALHPLLMMHGLVAQAPDWLGTLARERTTTSLADQIVQLSDMNALLGAPDLIALGKRYDS